MGAQHFMNKMGAPGSPDERFVDVFRGGALLTRCACSEFAVPAT